jgi:hypothetical protein
MSAVDGVDVLRVVAAGNPGDAGVRDVDADDGVPPAGLILVGGQVRHLPAGRPDRRTIQRSPAGQFPARLIRRVISATSLSSSVLPTRNLTSSWALWRFK